jgi:hypothetical protein
MTDRIFVAGKLTDLSDQRQLGRLNDYLSYILSVVNRLDPNAFALAWIEGFAAGAVIASKGVGNSPEWDTTPLLTGLTLSGLSASRPVVTNGSKALSSGTPDSGWAITPGYTPTKTLDPEAVGLTLKTLARVVGTLIDALKTEGYLTS